MLRDSYGINLEVLTVKNIKEAGASARLLLYYVSYEPFTEITVTETVRPGWTG